MKTERKKDASRQIKKETFKRETFKQRGFKRFLKSWSFSMQGLAYAYKYEQSMLIHFCATIAAIILGIFLKITPYEWLSIFMAIGIVLAMELINTAIEATIDLVTLEIHPLAKIAKDTGSAATFVVSIIAAVVGCIVFLPKIVEILF